jgi:hypothetical protein
MEDLISNLRDLIKLLKKAAEAHRDCVPEEDYDLFNDCEGLCFKFLGHATSVVTLLRGSWIDLPDRAFVDRPSVAAVCRAAWEACLIFHSVAAQSSDPAERRLRHRSWQYSSGQRRQNYHAVSDWEKTCLAEDKTELEKVWKHIEGNPEFQKWSAQEQQNLRQRGRWPRPGWKKLADLARISPAYGHDHYDYLCDRAHSGNISVRGLKDQPTPQMSQVFRNASLIVLCIGAALLINNYLTLFDSLREQVLEDDQQEALLSEWAQFGRKTPEPEELE